MSQVKFCLSNTSCGLTGCNGIFCPPPPSQIPPKFQSLLIHHVENSDEEDWKGYVYVFGLFAVNMAATLIYNQHTFYMVLAGGRIYTSLVCAIYDKSLKLSPTARKQRTRKKNGLSLQSNLPTWKKSREQSNFSKGCATNFCTLEWLGN